MNSAVLLSGNGERVAWTTLADHVGTDLFPYSAPGSLCCWQVGLVSQASFLAAHLEVWQRASQ